MLVDTDRTAPPDSPDSDETDLPGGLGTIWSVGGQITCADPQSRLSTGPFREGTVPIQAPSLPYFEGLAAIVADLDEDGREDVVVVNQTTAQVLWQDGPIAGTPLITVASEPWRGDRTGFVGVTAADFDGDDDLDLFITGRQVPDHYLRNDGGRLLVEATADVGLAEADVDHHTTSSSLSDIDADGDLDIFIGGYGYTPELEEDSSTNWFPGPSRLFLNDGSGHFSDVTDRLPASAHRGFAFMGAWLDGDGDGDDDLYIINDFGPTHEPNRLMINDGGWFSEDSAGRGLDVRMYGMGLAMGDLDGDGDEDALVAGWNELRVLGQSSHLWFESASVLGFTVSDDQTVAWGAEALDINNDGLLDVHVPYGYLVTRFGRPELLQPDALFIQGPPGQFTDDAARYRLDTPTSHRVSAPGDLNGDGWLDLVKPGTDGVMRFYSSRCGSDGWMKVDLRQHHVANTRAVGATVRIFAGTSQWMRRVRAGGTGFGGGQSPVLHFGLGDVASVDRVEITWPDGVVDTLPGFDVRQTLRVDRGR